MVHDIQLLAKRVSTKGSCAAPETNAIGNKTSDMHFDSVGLHVIVENSTKLVALGKVYESFGTIHTCLTQTMLFG